MGANLQLRRGSTSDHSGFTGLLAEVTVDTNKNTVVVHDASTVGGHPLAKESDLSSLAPQATTYTKDEVDAALATINTSVTQAQIMAYIN